jgi:hypothetical protein
LLIQAKRSFQISTENLTEPISLFDGIAVF